jgi:hypothetical protein
MSKQDNTVQAFPKVFRNLGAFLKGATFYRKAVSASFLLLSGMLAVTFFYDLHLLRRSQDPVNHNALVIAAALPSLFLGILLHRSRVRQILRKRPADEILLNEMVSFLLTLTFVFCLMAAMAAAR